MNTTAKKSAHATAKRLNESNDVRVWEGEKHITFEMWDGSRGRLARRETNFMKAGAKAAGTSAAHFFVRFIETLFRGLAKQARQQKA